MSIILIAAMSENRVIARNGDLPWHLPDDLKRFMRVTTGHPVIMGRTTWETLDRPLPRRRNIVVSRQADYAAEGADVVGSLEAAFELAAAVEGAEEIYVIGGGKIYEQSLALATHLDLTIVHTTIDDGDVFFPQVKWGEWDLQEESHHARDERHAHAFSFRRYVRSPQDSESGSATTL